MENIRNFCIIAHIDHGKSTLADRLLEHTGSIEARKMKSQYLDQLDLERERGITIKMAPVRMIYRPQNKTLADSEYIFNLIDTPGHSDFSYEVSRALMAVEGAILLVDASQGVQAQTLANFNNAKKAGLTIIGAVNKIDLNPAGLKDVIRDTAKLIGCNPEDVLKVSGKTGAGIPELLEAITTKIPPPTAPNKDGFQSLIFDSLYHEHKGDIAYVRVFSGQIKEGDEILMSATGAKSKAKEIGVFAPELIKTGRLSAGESGYIATGIKDPSKVKIGDTILLNDPGRRSSPLPGFKDPNPVVFVSFYPIEGSNYDELEAALKKLKMNDYALFFEPDRSEVLGRGFKCGFLGRLHFEITIERLSREFNLSVMTSFPSVAYTLETIYGKTIIHNPKDFPDEYISAWQPMVKIEVIVPPSYLNNVLQLTQIFHINDIHTGNFGDNIILTFKMPLADLIRDFDDKIKSLTEGFASFNYEYIGEEKGQVDRLEILVAEEVVSGLTRVVARDELEKEGRAMAEKLKDLLPRQQFMQAIQAKSRGRIIARETIPAMRKDVTGYLYGGDRTRKMKLWKKQAKGKKRLEARGKGSVNISPEVFRELLKK